MLVRDVRFSFRSLPISSPSSQHDIYSQAANPSQNDPDLPFSRAFDWFHGHSWAKGLFESADGKDEESSSEDAFFAYALKMWGATIGDGSMEARGSLMLAVMKRSFGNYLLLEDGNGNHPARFVGNKVTGIVSLVPPLFYLMRISDPQRPSAF